MFIKLKVFDNSVIINTDSIAYVDISIRLVDNLNSRFPAIVSRMHRDSFPDAVETLVVCVYFVNTDRETLDLTLFGEAAETFVSYMNTACSFGVDRP